MIHGFRGTHDGLHLIAQQLESRFFVITPDLPGFGDSSEFMNGQHNLPNYNSFLAEFIDLLNLTTKPILLGHSFGSILVSSFVSKNNAAISKLILINPISAPALAGPKAVLSKLALAYYQVGAKLPGRLGYTWLAAKPIVWLMSKTMTKTDDKQLIKYIDNQHYRHFSRFKSKQSVLETFEVSISSTVRDFAAEISAPTLLVVGDQDDIAPLDKQRELAALLTNATLRIIEGVGHLIHYETPELAAKHITKFAT